MPSKFMPFPIGQETGTDGRPSTSSNSCTRSNGSLVSRSSLLIKVKIGMPRMEQTLNSFFVCASIPLAPSMTMTALSTEVKIR